MTRLANPAAVARFADDNVAHFPNGEGGDFTTAKMTILSDSETTFYAPIVVDEGENKGIIPELVTEANVSATYDIVLYSGLAAIETVTSSENITLSGDAEVVATEPNTKIKVSGDCSITVTGGIEE